MLYFHDCSFSAEMHSLLDMAKIADSLLFVLDTTEGWDTYGDYCLSCLFAQGLPSHGGWPCLAPAVASFRPQTLLLILKTKIFVDILFYVFILCSTGVSWCVWPSCEEEGRGPESPLKDRRGPVSRHPSLPTRFGSRRHSPSETPGQPETEKAWFPLQAFSSSGSACHIYPQQSQWGIRWWI